MLAPRAAGFKLQIRPCFFMFTFIANLSFRLGPVNVCSSGSRFKTNSHNKIICRSRYSIKLPWSGGPPCATPPPTFTTVLLPINVIVICPRKRRRTLNKNCLLMVRVGGDKTHPPLHFKINRDRLKPTPVYLPVLPAARHRCRRSLFIGGSCGRGPSCFSRPSIIYINETNGFVKDRCLIQK